MTDEVHATPSDATVLIAVREDRNRELLTEWLADAGYEWVVVDLDDVPFGLSDGRIDLCITDLGGARRAGERIAEYRNQQRPRYVPWLLLLPGEDSRSSRRPEVPTGGEEIDDVISVPVRKRELERRIETLLRAREFSVELDQRREQYRRLVGLAPEAILLLDDDEVVYGNEAAVSLLRGPDARGPGGIALEGQSFTSFVAEEDRGRVGELLEGMGDGTGSTEFVEATLVPETGEFVLAEVAGVRVPHREGFVNQLVVRDVTERELRDRRLRLFARGMEEASIGVSIGDVTQPDDPLVYVNQTFEEVTGYEAAEVLGRNCRFLQGPGTDPEAVAEIAEAIENREYVRTRILNYRKDGTPFYNELELTPVENEDGVVTHYIGFQRDVTERENRKRELERYETIVANAGEGIYALDAEGRFTSVNATMEDLTGYDRSELLGQHVSLVMDEDDIEACERTIRDLLQSDRDAEAVEIDIHTADGRQRNAIVTLALSPFEDEFRGTVGVIRDVTEVRQREQQLAVMDRILRHDIRNTLNVVRGRAEMLQATGEYHPDHVAEILDATDSLLRLSEDARRFHKTLGRNADASRTTDLVDRAVEIVDRYRSMYPAAEITLDAPDSAIVGAHPGIHYALDELVENAIFHNDREAPSVEVSISVEADNVVLEVADDGPGIPEGERSTLKGDVESALEHASGLGLWIVTWLVRADGGSIECLSNEPRGTRIVVRLQRATDGN